MDENFPSFPIEPSARIDRTLIGTSFVGILVGLAFSEAVGPIRESLDSRGITAGTLALSIMFFFIALHLFISSFVRLGAFRGIAWFGAFTLGTFQSIILIFMAAFCSEAANIGARFNFLDYLVVFYAVGLINVILVPLAGFLPALGAFVKEGSISGAVVLVLAPFLEAVWLIPPLVISLLLRAKTETFSTSILFYILVTIQVSYSLGATVATSLRTRLFAEDDSQAESH